MTPKISERPSAVTANSPPSSVPVTAAWASSWPLGRSIGVRPLACFYPVVGLGLVVGNREQEVAGRLDVRQGGEHDGGLVTLPLELDDRQLRRVVGGELHGSDHVGLVRLADRRV